MRALRRKCVYAQRLEVCGVAGGDADCGRASGVGGRDSSGDFGLRRSRTEACVSLAAGVPLRRLRGLLAARWVRAMPSPVCRVGRGLTGLSFERSVTKKERRSAREFFEHVGTVLEIPERQFDAFTAVYSSSHGYHALATLTRAGERAGLGRATALTAAAHALSDAISYWKKSGSSGEPLHEAATPGGIAAATMLAMDEAGYARVVEDGLPAGIQQARAQCQAVSGGSSGCEGGLLFPSAGFALAGPPGRLFLRVFDF